MQPLQTIQEFEMTRFAKIFLTMLAVILPATMSEAQSVLFGNSPAGGTGFSVSAQSPPNATGGAVAFTPSEDMSFSSITVWLSGYNGLDVFGNLNQSFYAGIWTDAAPAPGGVDQPQADIDPLSVPPPNDGSLAAFTFDNLSPSTILSANTEYWLVIYENTGGSIAVGSTWVGGNVPVGNATYDGSDRFSFPAGFTSSSIIPAFEINAAPEPGAIAFDTLSILFGGLYAFRLRRHTSPAVKAVGRS